MGLEIKFQTKSLGEVHRKERYESQHFKHWRIYKHMFFFCTSKVSFLHNKQILFWCKRDCCARRNRCPCTDKLYVCCTRTTISSGKIKTSDTSTNLRSVGLNLGAVFYHLKHMRHLLQTLLNQRLSTPKTMNGGRRLAPP